VEKGVGESRNRGKGGENKVELKEQHVFYAGRGGRGELKAEVDRKKVLRSEDEGENKVCTKWVASYRTALERWGRDNGL